LIVYLFFPLGFVKMNLFRMKELIYGLLERFLLSPELIDRHEGFQSSVF